MNEKKPHPNDMTREELREVVSAMSWMALDLAQHLSFTIELLKDEYKAEAYARACRMAYELSDFPYNEEIQVERSNCDISVFGAGGITKVSSFVGGAERRAEGTPRAGSNGDHSPTPDATSAAGNKSFAKATGAQQP